MYVFDTSPFSALFGSFYPRRFPSLWAQFDRMIEARTIVSTREVRRELERYGNGACQVWLRDHREVFTTPTPAEAQLVGDIYRARHFQQNIELKKIQKGGLNADPFVIAKAAIDGRTVVTLETAPPHGARIPNICRHFGLLCMSLEEFMEREGWQF
jgi:Domain of unknown function (DUF4411)